MESNRDVMNDVDEISSNTKFSRNKFSIRLESSENWFTFFRWQNVYPAKSENLFEELKYDSE